MHTTEKGSVMVSANSFVVLGSLLKSLKRALRSCLHTRGCVVCGVAPLRILLGIQNEGFVACRHIFTTLYLTYNDQQNDHNL